MASIKQIKCCRNCKHLVDYPKNNHYGDIEHLCLVTGYFTTAINKDTTKVKRYTPGGKELVCEWEER